MFGLNCHKIMDDGRKLLREEASLFVLLTLHYPCYQIKSNETGGACGIYWGRGEIHTGFWWGNLRERVSLENLDICGNAI
jgi:hypothetical protein